MTDEVRARSKPVPPGTRWMELENMVPLPDRDRDQRDHLHAGPFQFGNDDAGH